MRWNSAKTAFITTCCLSQSKSIQLKIVKLFLFIHLLEKALHLIHRQGEALLGSDVHNPEVTLPV